MEDRITLANAPESLEPMFESGRIPLRRVWGMLALRSALSLGLLLSLAAAYALSAHRDPVGAAAAWWLWFVTVTNVVSIVLMRRFSRLEGMRLREIYYVCGRTWRGDLLWALVFLAGSVVLAMPPGMLLAKVLWGDVNYPNDLLFQALPLLAVYPLFVLMPLTQALAELPTYWGYVAPRLRASGMNKWVVVAVVGSFLSVQHLCFSLRLDWRYDLWLALKFLPFALWTGFVVMRRPTSLPYLMALHFVLDASLPVLALMASRGVPLG